MANRGYLSQQKLESGMKQASVSHTNPNDSEKPYLDENHPDQTQQTAPVDNMSTLQLNAVIESIESDDIEMQDLNTNCETENQR